MSYFFSFEGIDGVGKSTLIQGVSSWLNQHEQAHHLTREPGGSDLAEKIRQQLLSDAFVTATPLTQTLMMFAARVEHLTNTILPNLQQGKWVLSDRFSDSTYAYQAGIAGVATSYIDQLATWTHAEHWPDCTFWLDLPVTQALKRLQQRHSVNNNHWDYSSADHQENLRKIYEQRWRDYPQRIKRIDASLPLREVIKQVTNHLDAWL